MLMSEMTLSIQKARPRLRALALFGRWLHHRVDRHVMPATENLHKTGRVAAPSVVPILRPLK